MALQNFYLFRNCVIFADVPFTRDPLSIWFAYFLNEREYKYLPLYYIAFRTSRCYLVSKRWNEIKDALDFDVFGSKGLNFPTK